MSSPPSFGAAPGRAPQRVDVGQAFDSSWARIGAGDGGQLVVTWVQEFGVESDRMFSATLDPGATGFQAPVPIDFNVGEANLTFPDLAMNRGGQAYLVYRVVTDTSAANPPGYIGADVRLARYSGRLWSVLRHADRPQHRQPGQVADRGQLAQGGDRRARAGGGRLAGARRRVRRPRLGTAPLRRQRRHPAPGQPFDLGRSAAARAR